MCSKSEELGNNNVIYDFNCLQKSLSIKNALSNDCCSIQRIQAETNMHVEISNQEHPIHTVTNFIVPFTMNHCDKWIATL